jgi:hypothetical protein
VVRGLSLGTVISLIFVLVGAGNASIAKFT